MGVIVERIIYVLIVRGRVEIKIAQPITVEKKSDW